MVWGVPDSVPSLVPGTDDSQTASPLYSDIFISIETEPAPIAGGTSPLELLRNSLTGTCKQRVRGHMKAKYPGGPTEVRRPLPGLSLKAERHAFLQVYGKDGQVIPLYNQVGGWNVPAAKQDDFPGETAKHKSDHFTDFLVTGVQEQRAEKIQIVETFGEDYLYATGSRPQILSVTGYLCNSSDFPWRAEFWSNYNRYLRGSKLLENKYVAYFGWDDIIVEGYLMSAGAAESADRQDLVNFNFNFLVTDYISLAEMSFDHILQNLERTDNPAFWELTQRGDHQIYTDNNIVLTSEGMRARQRFMELLNGGVGGPLLQILQVNPALAAQMINSPEQFLQDFGAMATQKLQSKGNDLIWETLAYGQNRTSKTLACSKSDLTTKQLYEEGWQTATGWIRKLLNIMQRAQVVDVDAIGWPTMYWDLRYMLTSPLSFLDIVASQTADSDGGSPVYSLIGAIAGTMLATSFAVDVIASFVPAGNQLTTTGTGQLGQAAANAIFS